MSSALSPPAAGPPRSSSRSGRRRKRGLKGRGAGDGTDDASSRASSASPSPSPSPSPNPSQPRRVPSSNLSQPPLSASTPADAALSPRDKSKQRGLSPNNNNNTKRPPPSPSSPSSSSTSTPRKSALASSSSSSQQSSAEPFRHPFPNIPYLQRIIEPRATSIALLGNTPAARLLRHVQPALVLAYYVARFPALVADPVAALSTDAFVIAALQLLWCIACVPPYSGPLSTGKSGSSTAGAGAGGAAAGGGGYGGGGADNGNSGSSSSVAGSGGISGTPPTKRKGPKRVISGGGGGGGSGGGADHHLGSAGSGSGSGSNVSLGGRLTTGVLSVALALAATVPMAVLIVLFGAPATTHWAHTALLSVHVALLAVLPLVYARGVDAQAWWEAAALMLPCDAVAGGAAGACVGAWLGAVPIPLDWDREWQKWPVTIVTGAYLGSIAGRYAGAYLLMGRRLRFEEFWDDDLQN